MKLIVAGGRDFTNYPFLVQKLDSLLINTPPEDITIISGTANGVDKLGERYSVDRQLNLEQYPADWDQHGRAAGYIRNSQMADVSTHLVAFWDGKSKGTNHMINLATQKGLVVRVVRY